MKTITIRELHHRTGEWVRAAVRHGGLAITDRGQTIAKIVPHADAPGLPYFARRTLSPAFQRLEAEGKLRGGTDSTALISEARDER